MANSSNNNVFVQMQAVLNNDWIVRSKRNLTQVLEEIEKIGVDEIRFQRGGHVVFGSLDQFIRIQDRLLGNTDSGTPGGFRRRTSRETSRSEDLRTRDIDEPSINGFMARGMLEADSHIEIANNDDSFLDTKDPYGNDSTMNSTGTKELMVDRDIWEYIESKKRADVKELETVFEATITKAEHESGILMLILKSRRGHSGDLDVLLESLAALYEEAATGCVTETLDFQLSNIESKLALEYISGKFSDVLVRKCMYDNGFLFIGPSREVRESRKQFHALARRLTTGQLSATADERQRRQQPILPKHRHRKAIDVDDYDERSRDSHYANTIEESFGDLDFTSKDLSVSKYDKDDDMIVIADDEKEEIQDRANLRDHHYELHKQDDVDGYEHARNKNRAENYSETERNVLSNSLTAHSAGEKEMAADVLEAESGAGRGFEADVRDDKHLYNEDEPERKGRNLKTEDISSSVENLALGRGLEEDRNIGQEAKIDTDATDLFSTELVQPREPDAVSSSAENSTPTKKTKKSMKLKKMSYDLPKVKIVKQKLPTADEPSVFANAPVSSHDSKAKAKSSYTADSTHQIPKSITSENVERQVPESSCQQLLSKEDRQLKELFREQRKNLQKKLYDSPSSSDSEDVVKNFRKAQDPKKQKSVAFTAGHGQVVRENEPEELNLKGDENIEAMIEELMYKDDKVSQAMLQKLLERISNSDVKVDTTSTADTGKVREHEAQSAGDTQELNQSSPALENAFPQPPGGTIACIIDKGFHLSGFSKSGTIEISMIFEAGYQGEDQPEPGRPYKSMKLKAFLPASGDGREALRLMKGAFTARKLFKMARNDVRGEDDVIVPNGIKFKEAADQFPDSDYLPDVTDILRKLTA